MLWSDTSYEKLLREYIKTRRWTPFKLFYELGKAGAMLGGCIRCEDLDTYQGAVVVADFDLLSEEEQQKVASYRGGPVLAVMPADFDTGDLIVVLLLLLMSSDCKEDQNTALLTLVLYLLL